MVARGLEGAEGAVLADWHRGVLRGPDSLPNEAVRLHARQWLLEVMRLEMHGAAHEWQSVSVTAERGFGQERV